MARTRISTTVDPDLLADARSAHGGGTDASLMEAALRSFLDQHRRAEIDADYARGYAEQPLDQPDEWGDLASFGDAVRAR